MDLKQALVTAAQYADQRHLSLGNISALGGRISATNGTSGVEVPCPAIDGMAFAVDAKHWLAQVSALAPPIVLRVDDGKLITSAKGAHFSIQIDTEERTPARRAVPKTGWVPRSAEVIQTLATIAGFVPDKPVAGAHQLTGVRITPHFVMGGNSNRFVISRIGGLVEKPVIVPPALFTGIGGECEMCVQATSAWIRTPDGEIRWVALLDGDYPDDVDSGLIPAIKSGTPTQLDIGELARVAAVALIEFDGVGGLLVEVGGGALRIKGGAHGGISSVNVAMDLADQAATGKVGLNPRYLADAAAAMAQAVGGDATCRFWIGEAKTPVLFANGAPGIEVIVGPVLIDG